MIIIGSIAPSRPVPPVPSRRSANSPNAPCSPLTCALTLPLTVLFTSKYGLPYSTPFHLDEGHSSTKTNKRHFAIFSIFLPSSCYRVFAPSPTVSASASPAVAMRMRKPRTRATPSFLSSMFLTSRASSPSRSQTNK